MKVSREVELLIHYLNGHELHPELDTLFKTEPPYQKIGLIRDALRALGENDSPDTCLQIAKEIARSHGYDKGI